MIELHSMPTSNGQKVMLMLEETGLPWKHVDVNIMAGDQFSPDYLRLSPNNRIPAIVDPAGPGGRYTMMESGAILVYLAGKTGKFLPRSVRGKYDVLQWLMFQMAHVGPMFGQAGHFTNRPEPVDAGLQYARERYNNEVLRLFRVLDNRLGESKWLGGAEYSIADIATWPWTRRYRVRLGDGSAHPHFTRWFHALEARPAAQRMVKMADEIMARMTEEGKNRPRINISDTRDNAERLGKATKG